MTAQELLMLVLKISLGLSIFAIGMTATFDDATYLFRWPAKLLRALLSMYVLVPAFALALCAVLNPNPAVKIALVFLSLAPIPPILPNKALKAGGRENYAVGLLVATSLIAIVVIPLAMALFERLFSIPLEMSAAAVTTLVFASLLIPLAAGIALHALAPAFAEHASRLVALAATVLLVVSFLPVLVALRESMFSLIGDGTLVAFAAFAAFGLIAGHLLGGPPAEDRPVLALYSSTRHPAIAVAMAQANFPEQKLALTAILLALLAGGIVSTLYIALTKEQKPAVRA